MKNRTLANAVANVTLSMLRFASEGLALRFAWKMMAPSKLVLFLLLAGWIAPAATRAEADGRFPVEVDEDAGEFCLIVVPDTQRYAAYFPRIFRSQFEWIRDTHESLNVKYVIHVGDVVEEGEEAEWRVADDAFSLIDGEVPYMVVPGNHDIDPESLDAGARATSEYNAVFSPKRFEGRRWYGGSNGVKNDNSFGYFEAAGKEFMVLGLEYAPTDESLAWAKSLLSNHKQNVILATHCYMYDDDTRLGEGDLYSPHGKNPTWNDGEQIWEKLVYGSDSITMVLSGHVKGDGTGLLISDNEEGKPVVQMLANYQFLSHGGEGWLRILKFIPGENKLEVFTYSPWLKAFREEPDQRFSVEMPWMFE